MSATFSGTNRIQILAGQRAAFTKALQAYSQTEDEDKRHIAITKMAEILKRAPAKGFTKDEVAQGADIPSDVTSLLGEDNAVVQAAEAPLEDPARLVGELQQTVDASDQRIIGCGRQFVYAYGYKCAPDRLKVGRTDGDVITRVARQINSSTPDKPSIFLIIQTEDCRGFEMAIHGFLRLRGRRVLGGGDEWFLTSCDELIRIHNVITDNRSLISQEPVLPA